MLIRVYYLFTTILLLFTYYLPTIYYYLLLFTKVYYYLPTEVYNHLQVMALTAIIQKHQNIASGLESDFFVSQKSLFEGIWTLIYYIPACSLTESEWYFERASMEYAISTTLSTCNISKIEFWVSATQTGIEWLATEFKVQAEVYVVGDPRESNLNEWICSALKREENIVALTKGFFIDLSKARLIKDFPEHSSVFASMTSVEFMPEVFHKIAAKFNTKHFVNGHALIVKYDTSTIDLFTNAQTLATKMVIREPGSAMIALTVAAHSTNPDTIYPIEYFLDKGCQLRNYSDPMAKYRIRMTCHPSACGLQVPNYCQEEFIFYPKQNLDLELGSHFSAVNTDGVGFNIDGVNNIYKHMYSAFEDPRRGIFIRRGTDQHIVKKLHLIADSNYHVRIWKQHHGSWDFTHWTQERWRTEFGATRWGQLENRCSGSIQKLVISMAILEDYGGLVVNLGRDRLIPAQTIPDFLLRSSATVFQNFESRDLIPIVIAAQPYSVIPTFYNKLYGKVTSHARLEPIILSPEAVIYPDYYVTDSKDLPFQLKKWNLFKN